MTKMEAATKAAALKKRSQTHCKNGHFLSGENLAIRKNDGTRICKICKSDRDYRNRAILKGKLLADPNHEKHGSSYGYNVGCRCYRCCFAISEYTKKYKANKNLGA